MKKRIKIQLIVILFSLLLTTNINGQNSTPHFGLQVGSSFSHMGSFGNMFTQSIAPAMNWEMSERFSLQVGTVLSTSRMNGLIPYEGHFSGGQLFTPDAASRFNSMTIYAFGAYKLNPRLTISGGTWMEQSGFSFAESFQQSGNAYNPQGMMLGLDYRVNENLRFGFEVSMSRGYNPYIPGFYQHPVFPAGFNRNPFSRYPH